MTVRLTMAQAKILGDAVKFKIHYVTPQTRATCEALARAGYLEPRGWSAYVPTEKGKTFRDGK